SNVAAPVTWLAIGPTCSKPTTRGSAACRSSTARTAAVFMSDWCDAGECHDYIDIHRENGRIYKVTYGTPISSSANLAKLSDAELVNLQLHKNEWFVSHARLLLQERAVSGKLEPQTRPALL